MTIMECSGVEDEMHTVSQQVGFHLQAVRQLWQLAGQGLNPVSSGGLSCHPGGCEAASPCMLGQHPCPHECHYL